MKKFLGIIVGGIGFYTGYILWNIDVLLAVLLGVVSLSFLIESFKRRYFQFYDYTALVIILGVFIYKVVL